MFSFMLPLKMPVLSQGDRKSLGIWSEQREGKGIMVGLGEELGRVVVV